MSRVAPVSSPAVMRREAARAETEHALGGLDVLAREDRLADLAERRPVLEVRVERHLAHERVARVRIRRGSDARPRDSARAPSRARRALRRRARDRRGPADRSRRRHRRRARASNASTASCHRCARSARSPRASSSFAVPSARVPMIWFDASTCDAEAARRRSATRLHMPREAPTETTRPAQTHRNCRETIIVRRIDPARRRSFLRTNVQSPRMCGRRMPAPESALAISGADVTVKRRPRVWRE